MEKYGIIIIDDEEMMRDGLSSFLNWEEMGFRLDGIFEDGRDAMEWLGENDTHVILTDLRMTHSSGLDVAAFVRDKGLNIKIVIISGHTDFEAAREAMGYRVSDYLMKPISVKKIRETFAKLKKELDEERNSRTLIDSEINRFESLNSYVEERFLSNLVMGALRRPEDLAEQLILMNWDPEVQNKPCMLFSLSVKADTDLQGEYDSSERNSLIGGMIARRFPPPRFYWYRTSRTDLGGILFNCGELEGLKERVRRFLGEITEQARDLSLNIVVGHVRSYEDLNALARNRETDGDEWDDGSFKEESEEQKRAIISSILENRDDLTQEMITSYMNSLHKRSWDYLINGLVELFTQINGTFRNKKNDYSDLISFAEFFSLRDRSAVYDWVRQKLSEITATIQNNASTNQLTLINKAKEYVERNFADDVMLTQVAEEVNLSPVYLSRLFKEKGGMNYSDFLIRCRIREACRLLRETDRKIYEISEEVGYGDVKHFYSLFKKQTGRTPSEYRHDR